MHQRSASPWSLFAVQITGVLMGGFLGGLTNAFNGWVSPDYFISIMRWRGVSHLWRAIIAQGVFEGFCFGAVFTLIFCVGAGWITHARCSYAFAISYLIRVLLISLICWLVGGMASLGIAVLSPERYQDLPHVPESYSGMLAFAWVAGSIWGIEFGGIIAVCLALVGLRADWPSIHENEAKKMTEDST